MPFIAYQNHPTIVKRAIIAIFCLKIGVQKKILRHIQ
jgi:hypothetical protein